MLKNSSRPINSLSAVSESLSAAAVTPHKPFPLMLGSQASVLVYTLNFLSARDATSVSLSTASLNTAIKSPAFQALWLQHIQRDYPGPVAYQPSPQGYYQAAQRFQQDKTLNFLLYPPFNQPFNQIEGYDYSMIKQTVSHFKTSTFKQRADCLTQWNKDLGLQQLKNAVHTDIRLQGLTELTPEVMQHLTAINQKSPIIKLSIQNCYLAQLPKALIIFLSTCNQLQELYLNHNQLQSLPETLLQVCTQLKLLSLDNNSLQSLPENLLQACTQLQQLYLSDNQLKSLPENLLQACIQLQELYLDNNQLKSLPETLLQACTQLTMLFLSHNQLQNLPENLLQACTQVKWLYLNHNPLQSLPEHLLQACTQLQNLSLSDNQLQSLPKTLLQTCTQLKTLSLDHNQLQSLPENLLQACTQLQGLSLTHNQLRSLPENFLQACTQLQGLFLGYNHLITVTRNSFSHLSKIIFLNIDSQTPVGSSNSSTISPEQKMAGDEDEPRQKKVKYQA